MILRLLWRPSWILAPPSWKLTNFDWLTIKIPITHVNEHFYQVSCVYPDMHDYCDFPLHYEGFHILHNDCLWFVGETNVSDCQFDRWM